MKKEETNQEEWRNPVADKIMELLPRTKSQITQKKNTKKSSNDLITKIKQNRYDKNNFDSEGITNVTDIKGGIVCCADGSFVKILEVIPLNYYQKEIPEKNKITDAFSRLFRTCPVDLHIKVRTEKADSCKIINNIHTTCQKANNPLLNKKAEDYIEKIYTPKWKKVD